MVRSTIPKTLFGRRLREARLRMGIAQDKLGVMIGMDEGTSSARMSRYETGVHEPAFETARKIATALNVPTAYFFCDDDILAQLIVIYSALTEQQRSDLLDRLQELSHQGN